MKTRTEVVNFLVSKGVPQNLAKVTVTEAYAAGAQEGSDLLYGWSFESNCEGPPEPIEINTVGANYMHDIVMDSVEFVKGGIAVEGILKYDMNGDLI